MRGDGRRRGVIFALQEGERLNVVPAEPNPLSLTHHPCVTCTVYYGLSCSRWVSAALCVSVS